MELSSLFKKTKRKNYITLPDEKDTSVSAPEVPEGLVRKCNACKTAVLADSIRNNHYVCPKCGNYFMVPAYRRISMIADEGSFEEWDTGLISGNPMHYKGYEEKIESFREKTGLDEAIVTGSATIGGEKVVLAVCDSRFMMASMGRVVGEKLTRAIERATDERRPIIIFTASGGARMQEGIFSLMQMSKTSAALKRHHDAGQLYITVLTNPTTGGVTASFAMLGDIILAEPKALVGFAGPRVIEQTIGQKLPKGFQRSEFLLEHGFVDQIVERDDQKQVLTQLLKLHDNSMQADHLESFLGEEKCASVTVEMADDSKKKTAWDRVILSRRNDRPVGNDYIYMLFDDFTELHGDRYYKDDPAIVGGVAYFHGMPVTVIAQAKGRNTKENINRNFGMPSPDGYRKALRLMKQAEKFNRPIICFVDTPGAFCGLEAEERGQGEAIARNLFEMSGLQVPVLSVVIGEGGSGGALALATSDEVWMLENTIYSILSPEGFASILWKDSKRAKEAAEIMRLTAGDLHKAGIVEKVLAEPENYTVENMLPVIEELEQSIKEFLGKQLILSGEEIAEKRYERFRRM